MISKGDFTPPTILLTSPLPLDTGVFPQSHCTVLEQNWEEIENMKEQTGTEIENKDLKSPTNKVQNQMASMVNSIILIHLEKS